MKNCLVLVYWILTIVSVQALCAAETTDSENGMDAAKRFLAPYSSFCSELSLAFKHGDTDKLVELTEPAFRIVLTNDISKFSLRFEEIRKSRVYCDTRFRREVYDEGFNSSIDRFIGDGIADLVPIEVVCLKDTASDKPTFDRLYVNTVLHTNGSIGIIGRFILGPYTSSEQVVSDLSALKNGCLDDSAAIYRMRPRSISASESAWRLARMFKAAFLRGESMEFFRTHVSPNAGEGDVVRELKRLSAYNIREIVPFGTDNQYIRNTVDARVGDVDAYLMVIYAEESPAREVGRIEVIVGADSGFRIRYAIDEGRLFGIEPCRSMTSDD